LVTSSERDLNPAVPPGVFEEGASKEDAFEQFISEKYGRIVSTVRLIVGDHATAEDITQEAFARAYLSWSKLWPEGNPAGWVHRVSTNLALSWRRRAGRELRAIQKLGRRTEMTTPAPDAYPELHRAIAGLPRRQRAAVALHYTLGLSMEESAAAMGCAAGTVKSLLFSARERLRTQLQDDDS
jgi:RNA polymerase sigma-70 factor (ECF subfamily)